MKITVLGAGNMGSAFVSQLVRAGHQVRVTARDAAKAADGMAKLLLQAIKETGVADDNRLDPMDMVDLNRWIIVNKLDEWTKLHGDDEGAFEIAEQVAVS